MTHKEHQRQLKRIHQQIASGLHEAKLPDRQRREYQAAIQDIVGRLGPRAVERLHRFAGGYKFYQSHRALTQGIKGKYANLRIPAGKVLKGMFDTDGILHLDGGGKLYGRTARCQEFQAHEIAHAIDGHRELSSTPEWRRAWQVEIADGGFLGENSAASPHEGWGDFGALVLGTEIYRQEIRQVMPRALGFWEKRGLL